MAPGLFLWQAGRARRVAAHPAIRLCAVARLCRALPQGRHSRVRRPLFLRQTVQRRRPVQAGASVFDARERYKLPCPVGKSKKLSLQVSSEGRKERQFCDCQKIQTKKQGPVSRALSAAGPETGPV